MPSAEQMPGIQSTNFTCTLDPFLALAEKAEASMRKKRPRENYIFVTLLDIARKKGLWWLIGRQTYQCARCVDAGCSDG
jgi:hypothetical protein